MPPNSAGSAESAPGAGTEQFTAGVGEHAPAGEAPRAGAGQQPSVSAAPVLSAADVAAAIAAVPSVTSPTGAVPTPTVAGDVDVIEPEWVDRAEQVVQAHQGDPYGQEEAIEDLQQEYLKKRYGYTVADPKSDSSKPEGT
jgi:hypothetical protein